MLRWTTIAIAGPSMEPSTASGDWWLVRRTQRVRPQQVIAFRHPLRPSLIVVKRAIRPVEDGWWVEGDNARFSDDSRTFGPVPKACIIGRLVWRYRRGADTSPS